MSNLTFVRNQLMLIKSIVLLAKKIINISYKNTIYLIILENSETTFIWIVCLYGILVDKLWRFLVRAYFPLIRHFIVLIFLLLDI